MHKKKYAIFCEVFLLLLNVFSLTVSSQIEHDHRISNPEDSYDMVIIAPSRYTHDVQSLIDYKNSVGVKTFLKTTESIYNEFNGYDIQEKIKIFIKQTYDTLNIKYVLFIGDYQQNPPRYCYNNDSYYNMEPCFISDLYFADLYDDHGIFSFWDTDHDGLYGEWNGLSADDYNISLTPEIGIGRLPCHNRFELYVMIHKIILYEKNTANSDWFNNFVVAGGDTYSPASGYSGPLFNTMEGEVFTEEALQVMSGCRPVRLWASTGTLTSLNLLRAINTGCGFVYLSGHGSPTVWVTYPYNSTRSIGYFSNGMMPLLINGRKLPICIVSGCENSKFDVRFRDCWSWRLMSKPFGGAIATIGNTGLSWLGIEYGGGGNNWIILQFFKEYVNGTEILGDVWKNAICTYLDTFPIDWNTANAGISSLDAKTVQEWVLFGDPSLKIGGYKTD
jgi:hypothetical protein